MKQKFNLTKFILVLAVSHLVVYICWSFVSLSFSEPIIETLKDNSSRGAYLWFLFVVLVLGAVFYIEE